MASNTAVVPLPTASLRFQVSQRIGGRNYAPNAGGKKAPLSCRAAKSEEVTDEQSATESSVRTQLNLLEQLTSSGNITRGYVRDDGATRPTIREQLVELTRSRDGDFTVRLDKKMKESLKILNVLTVSQRRNIKRQTYLNEVSRRKDGAFFAAIGAFVILPPVVILAVAIQTGYVHLFP